MLDREEGDPSHRGSRATSPGGCRRELNSSSVIEVSALCETPVDEWGNEAGAQTKNASLKPSRYRPRTFPYQRYLPYQHDDRQYENLYDCISNLYVAVSAGDFVPGATHWTRELKGWIQLKFNLPRADRIRLVKLYYELALAPGMDRSASDRFASMFMTLTKYFTIPDLKQDDSLMVQSDESIISRQAKIFTSIGALYTMNSSILCYLSTPPPSSVLQAATRK